MGLYPNETPRARSTPASALQRYTPSSVSASPRHRWALAAVVLFTLEVLIATEGAHLPFIRGELGDFLVVILLYALAKAAHPFRPLPLALGVFAIAAALEVGQSFGLADRLHLAKGGLLRVVVGTTFQWADLLMYAAGCVTAWAIDRPWRSSTP